MRELWCVLKIIIKKSVVWLVYGGRCHFISLCFILLSCVLGSRCDLLEFTSTASEIQPSIKAAGNFSVINVTDLSGQSQQFLRADSDGKTSFSGLVPGMHYLFTFSNGSSTCCQEVQIREWGFSFGDGLWVLENVSVFTFEQYCDGVVVKSADRESGSQVCFLGLSVFHCMTWG